MVQGPSTCRFACTKFGCWTPKIFDSCASPSRQARLSADSLLFGRREGSMASDKSLRVGASWFGLRKGKQQTPPQTLVTQLGSSRSEGPTAMRPPSIRICFLPHITNIGTVLQNIRRSHPQYFQLEENVFKPKSVQLQKLEVCQSLTLRFRRSQYHVVLL